MKTFELNQIIMSIFQNLASKYEDSKYFFKEIPNSARKAKSDQIEFQDVLYFSHNSQQVSPNEVFLTRNRIHFYTSQGVLIEIYLKWCILRAFIEESQDSEKKFGFTIESYGQMHDFYTENEEKLKLWMEKMSKMMILTGFDSDYVVIKHLASGSYGEVFLCQDIQTREEFAVKKVDKSRLAKIKTLNSLFNEISIQRKIDHGSIVKLFKVYQEEDSVCLVLEYVKYGTLLNRISNGNRVGEGEIMAFIRKFIIVLGFLHHIGIIHRDLKPDNILMVSKDNLCDFKIADFGISCKINNYQCVCSGSPGYMAPEMLKGNQYTAKIDIFSAGVIFYILFAGYFPFTGVSTKQIISSNLNCHVNFNFAASGPIKSLLKKMLSSNPNARPSASEILKLSPIFGNRSEDIFYIDNSQDFGPDYEHSSFSGLAHMYS